MNQTITIQSVIAAPIGKVWEYYTAPEHVVKWNQASADWHTTKAENVLRVGGKFMSRMEAKDGSVGFDFGGIYSDVVENNLIKYAMDDGRVVTVNMEEINGETKVEVEFDAETENSIELQRSGWQAILDNFKRYAEA